MGLREKTSEEKKIILPGTDLSISQNSRHSYDEQPIELDLIEQLKSNILMLDDLQQRLGFMNTEIESILGSKLNS